MSTVDNQALAWQAESNDFKQITACALMRNLKNNM
jgi:hypothetical protein